MRTTAYLFIIVSALVASGCGESTDTDNAPVFADYVYKNAGSHPLTLHDYRKTTDSIYHLGIDDSMQYRVKLYANQIDKFIGSDSVLIFFDTTPPQLLIRYNQIKSKRNIIFHESYSMVKNDDGFPKYLYTYTFSDEDYDSN
jgi:hypothetical protein